MSAGESNPKWGVKPSAVGCALLTCAFFESCTQSMWGAAWGSRHTSPWDMHSGSLENELWVSLLFLELGIVLS